MRSAETESWYAELAELVGPEGKDEVQAFIALLPAGYREHTSPAEGRRDMEEISALLAGAGSESPGPGGVVMGQHRLAVRPAHEEQCTFRLRRFGLDGMELTSTLPLLESFGLVVVESVPFRFLSGAERPAVYVDDMGVRTDAPYGPEALRFVPDIHGPRLVEAIEASAHGGADVDSLNRLVTAAGLDWRQVMVLRAYLRYWLQAGPTLSWDEMAEPLVEYPDVARGLIGYFQARFDPGESDADARAAAGQRERAGCEAQIELVAGLEQDRVLRGLLALVDATLRTNFFRATAADRPSPLVLKFDSRAVPILLPPRPYVEAFVHGPRVEGIHLRAGLIARGGLRWSERPSDFRTEVLDLAFAQVKKNAIIVPTGAKGGFVCRSPAVGHGAVHAKERPSPDEVRAAYEQFVAALLDITDNIVAGEVVSPPGVVASDGPDPYLVVAADKGTATFSDLANSLSDAVGFWLGDAFASGGSRGYDHKAMGITARGAWVAVRRHFRELGIDVAADPISVVGVGDMSGDVFGNGMLRSRAIRLVAAFDHRHIFVDPNPDPGPSFEERRRLASLERSSWADYSAEMISPGGGVWSRDTKLIPVSAQAQSVLGISADSLSPPEMIAAILAAPVDLLWFGGIGTYIKAVDEPDLDVGDRANDSVRITSDRVRARVIAEGANLGVTQRARIRYSRRGGRINADFIDNAAGVATSDREVNLKILLALAIERRRLEPGQRDGYLERSEEEVADEVLRQVDHSVAALNRAAATSERQLDAYEALIDGLDRAGRLDRRVEVLPTTEEFEIRRGAGAGLIRPELATILAYAKSDLVAAVETSPSVSDPLLLDSVLPYFPAPIREAFGDLVPDHRLYPQLVATDVAGEIVDQLGIVWAHDLAAEFGRPLADVAEAFWVARKLTGAGRLWRDLEALAGDPASGVDAAGEAALHALVAEAVTGLVRLYLLEPDGFDAAAVVERDRPLMDGLSEIGAGARPGVAGGVAAGGAAPGLGRPASWGALATKSNAALEELPSDLVARYTEAGTRLRVAEAATAARWAGQTPGSPADIERPLAALDEVQGARAVSDLGIRIDEALTSSPPPDRLRVWQARALDDDLGIWARRAAAAVLREGADPAEWLEARSRHFEEAAAIQAASAATADPLSVVTLVLRRLQRMFDGQPR